MNAPVPNFTSSESRSRPSASFLLMILATMSGLARHGAGHIAQGIEFFVGRTELRRLPDHGHAEGSTWAIVSSRREANAEPGDGLELVECAAGDAQARVRRSSGTQSPSQASNGASRREVLSPMPPVECLSTIGWMAIWPGERFAAVQHGVGERERFRRPSCRGKTRPSPARSSGSRAAGPPRTQRSARRSRREPSSWPSRFFSMRLGMCTA